MELDGHPHEKKKESSVVENLDKHRSAKQLPKPSGWKLLIALPEIDEKTEGGIIKPGSVAEIEELATVVGFVLEVGPDAYADEIKFPSGAWCKKGDFVVFRAYQGTRIKIHGKEFRLINDDTVEAVVQDPRGYARA